MPKKRPEPRYWADMEFEELIESVSQRVHSRLLEEGGKGIKLAVREILSDIACNKEKYFNPKDR